MLNSREAIDDNKESFVAFPGLPPKLNVGDLVKVLRPVYKADKFPILKQDLSAFEDGVVTKIHFGNRYVAPMFTIHFIDGTEYFFLEKDIKLIVSGA